MAYFEGSNAQANTDGGVTNGAKTINIGGNPNAVKTSYGVVFAVVVVALVAAYAFVASRRKG